MFVYNNGLVWYPRYEDNPPVPPASGGEDKDISFSEKQQEYIKNLLETERTQEKQRVEETYKGLKAEIDNLRKKTTLTTQERTEQDQRIQELTNLNKSKEAEIQREREKLIRDHKKEKDELTLDRDNWKRDYTESTILRSLTDAAIEHDAINPEQAVNILRPNTKLVEETDENGKPTGKLVPKVRYRDVDADGKPLDVDLDPSLAIKRMSESEKHYNLFKNKSAGGLGLHTNNDGKKQDIAQMATDPKAYREARAKGQTPFAEAKS